MYILKKEEIDKIEDGISYNAPASVKMSETRLRSIFRQINFGGILIEETGEIIKTKEDFNNWKKKHFLFNIFNIEEW